MLNLGMLLRCRRPWAGSLSAGGLEELPHVRGQGQRPRVPGCDGAGTAEGSYPASEVRGGSREELPRVQGQWRPGGDTPCPRSGWRPRGATLPPRSGAARRSDLAPEASGGDLEEPPMPESRAGGREEQPEEWWLRSTGGPRGAIPR